MDRKLEAVAKAIYWEMNAVMHDHEKNWRESGKKALYRDCARAALVAASHFCDCVEAHEPKCPAYGHS